MRHEQLLALAFARGCRLQVFSGGRWLVSSGPYKELDQRMHPEDVHKMYGPISSLIREQAAYGDIGSGVWGTEYGAFWLNTHDHLQAACAPKEQVQTYLLILAEALLWEGL